MRRAGATESHRVSGTENFGEYVSDFAQDPDGKAGRIWAYSKDSYEQMSKEAKELVGGGGQKKRIS